MTIVISLNSHTAGDLFLVAPSGGATFPARLALRSDDGSTTDAVLQVGAGGAGIQFERTNVRIGPYETTLAVHALSGSNARNDTVIEVVSGGTVAASLAITAIANPEVWFQGRFQARFATDGDPYNHPRGNADGTGNGWTWALEDESDFVPVDSVADRLDKPVGRVIRFHDAEALRPHVPPIGVSVVAVRGTVGAAREDFTSADPIIGQPVRLGPDTYFASNDPRNPADPLPEETYPAGLESMSNFELHMGERFSGTSSLGPYQGAVLSQNPRDPDDRPQANGLLALSAAEIAQYGIVPVQQFAEARLNQLLADHDALPPADQTGTPAGRNLRTRIAHLLPNVNATLRAQVTTSTGIAPAVATLPFGYIGKEEYTGLVNAGLALQPDGSPVLQYLAGFQSFVFFAKFFNFHSDELCGQVHGSLTADKATDPMEARGLSLLRASARRRRPADRADYRSNG